MSPGSWRCWWFCCCCLLGLDVRTRALEMDELFEFGEEAGDQQLQLDSDFTSELLLNQTMMFFSESFDKVYINTNGFVAFEAPPSEEEYLGKMPCSFKMIAALLGNLWNSDGRGQIYFRQDSSPAVLSQAAEHIGRAFPSEEGVEPIHALIVTWENVAVQGTFARGDGVDAKRNTFQLVVASTESSSWAILLYPSSRLQFLYTSVQEDMKLVEAGFNEGLISGWFWSTKQGTYFRTTTDDETSVRELTTKTNSGKNGVWVYNIGASSGFTDIIPGMVTSSPQDTTESPVTMLPRQTDEQQELDFSIHASQMTTEAVPEGKDEYHKEISEDYTAKPKLQTEKPDYEAPDRFEQEYPDTSATVSPTYTTTERGQQQINVYPDEPASRYPHSRHQRPQIVVFDEDLDVNVFSYNSGKCANSRHECSEFADCRDYRDGFCCHCRPGFYGNGKDCVAEGKHQRINGKVNGRVFVGNATSPVELDSYDLHSYVVPNDGRAYIAISNIPDNVGPSLQPLSSLGGIIGWAFALQQPGYQNGFSLIGGVFSRQAEVIFRPNNERLIIKQKFSGINEHGQLIMSTELEGRVPAIPLGYSVQINPYKEIYFYDTNMITSSSNRAYTVISPDRSVQTRSYLWRQAITFQNCPHDESSRATLSTQQLSVDQVFVMFDTQNHLIRYAMSNKIGSEHSDFPEQNPCFTGRHGCDINAVCRPGEGLQFNCECTVGFTGDGRYCFDIDECRETPQVCGRNAACSNQPGTFRCECFTGFTFASDRRTCIEESRPVDHCQRGSHDCDVPERAVCRYAGGSTFKCICLPGYEGDGRVCRDVDECRQDRCHREALCSNTQGSYSCQCRPGFQGDGFQCSPGSSEPEVTPCELHRERAQAAVDSTSSSGGFFSFFRPRPAVTQYVPQCDERGAYEPTQCHVSIGQCWCVDANGLEIPNTRSGPGSTPLCINQVVTPAPLGPTPRPDVHPVAPGTHLLFAQSGKIEHVPLDGYVMKKEEAKPLLHIPDRVVIAVAYDCVEKMVYWTEITGPAISKASVGGGDIIPVITKDLQSPEGIAIDHVARLVFWTDSMRDTIEVSKLDGSQRRVLFDKDLVNPRPIVTNSAYGRLYWADWNRDGPKIEMSNMDGTERSVLVKDDLGLPNGLTFDSDNQQLCWADAGTRRVECMDLHRQLRRQIVEGIQYPFGLVSFGKKLYYTDWRREAVVAVDRYLEKETEEFLPQKRSRLYGITTTPTECPRVFNYCSNNGGCSHLCLPRLGGFTCRCPDAADGQCEERSP